MSTKTKAAYAGWERRRENDERVAVNLPADFLPLWERIKVQFKGTPEERAEAFLQYAHEHGSELEAAVIDEAEARLVNEIRRWEGHVERSPNRMCQHEDCTSMVHARNVCAPHYRELMRTQKLFAPRKAKAIAA